MKAFFICDIVVLSLFALVILFFAIKGHKLFKTLIFNAFLGLCLLAIVDLTSKFTGMHIPLNPYSVSFGAAFGVPAVCMLLVLQIIL